jgi:hypothetical protein
MLEATTEQVDIVPVTMGTQPDSDTIGTLYKVNRIISTLGIPLEVEDFIHSSSLSLHICMYL